jgi:hypothetical protein
MADIDQLFATFRAEALTEIRPPGTGAARRTVRRRRTTRFTGVTVLAVAAVVAVGLLARPGPGVVGESPASGPAVSLDQLDQLGVDALAALGYAPTDHPLQPDLLPIRPGVVFGGLGDATEGYTYRLGTAAEPLPSGVYRLEAVCRGQGRVTVAWGQNGLTNSAEFACGEDSVDNPIVLDARGFLDLVITPDADAVGRAGVAVVITDPRLVAARTAIGVPTRVPTSSGEAVLVSPVTNVDESPVATFGEYRLDVACAGVGSVMVTFDSGAASQGRDVDCTPAGALTELTVAAQAGANLTVSFEPDAAATNNAAIVYRVTRE